MLSALALMLMPLYSRLDIMVMPSPWCLCPYTLALIPLRPRHHGNVLTLMPSCSRSDACALVLSPSCLCPHALALMFMSLMPSTLWKCSHSYTLTLILMPSCSHPCSRPYTLNIMVMVSPSYALCSRPYDCALVFSPSCPRHCGNVLALMISPWCLCPCAPAFIPSPWHLCPSLSVQLYALALILVSFFSRPHAYALDIMVMPSPLCSRPDAYALVIPPYALTLILVSLPVCSRPDDYAPMFSPSCLCSRPHVITLMLCPYAPTLVHLYSHPYSLMNLTLCLW